MQKWEYCYVYSVMPQEKQFFTRFPYMLKFNSKKPFVETYNLSISSQEDEILGDAKTIADLGEDGWEMVGTVSQSHDYSDYIHALYFKRAIEG